MKMFGFSVSQKVYTFGNGKPCIFVNAGTHGSELGGIITAFELIKWLDGKKLRGTVKVLPAANPYLTNNMLRYPEAVGKTNLIDFKNPNRVYPGDENGSFTERNAFTVSKIAKNSEFIIDLHNSRYSAPYVVCEESTFDIAKFAGTEIVEIAKIDNTELIKQGKGLIIELGPTGLVFKDGLDYVINLMGRLGIIESPAKLSTYFFYNGGEIKIRANEGLIVKYLKGLGDSEIKAKFLERTFIMMVERA